MGRLDVRIVQARNLPNTEMLGKADPYVTVQIEQTTHKTSVQSSTLNPKWDEVFKFVVADPDSAQMVMKLWDKNMLSDTFMGEYKLNLSGLTKGEVKDSWCLLQNCKSNAEINVRLMAHDFGRDPVAKPAAPAPAPAAVPQPVTVPVYPPEQIWTVAMARGGIVYGSGVDVNDHDGNTTHHRCTFTFTPGSTALGHIVGGMHYSAGSNYNAAEAAPINGSFMATGFDHPPPPADEYTRFEAGDHIAFEQKYHGGKSLFYFSGKVRGPSIVGRYKMKGRNAIGTFTITAAAYEPLSTSTDSDFA